MTARILERTEIEQIKVSRDRWAVAASFMFGALVVALWMMIS